MAAIACRMAVLNRAPPARYRSAPGRSARRCGWPPAVPSAVAPRSWRRPALAAGRHPLADHRIGLVDGSAEVVFALYASAPGDRVRRVCTRPGAVAGTARSPCAASGARACLPGQGIRSRIDIPFRINRGLDGLSDGGYVGNASLRPSWNRRKQNEKFLNTRVTSHRLAAGFDVVDDAAP